MRVKITCEEWNIWRELKGTKCKGGNAKVKVEIKKVQTVPKGENKTHEGEIKCEGVK